MAKKEDPLIRVVINWAKARRYLITALKKIGELGKLALKIILKLLTALLLLLLATYKKLSKFAKSRQSGGWILILFFLFSIIVLSLNIRRLKETEKFKRDYIILEKLYQGRYDELLERQKEIEKKLEEKEQEKEEVKKPMSQKRSTPRELSATVKESITRNASENGVSIAVCECIIQRESGGNPAATGDGGRAIGVAQYHLGTFYSHRRQMGLSQEDLRRDVEASIQALTWAISKGYGYAWTTYADCV